MADDIGFSTNSFYGRKRNLPVIPISVNNEDSEDDMFEDDDSVGDPNFSPPRSPLGDIDSEDVIESDEAVANNMSITEETAVIEIQEGDFDQDETITPDRSIRVSNRTLRSSWQPQDREDATVDHEFEGPDIEEEDLLTPYQMFKNIITNDFLDIVVTQSNLYSCQRNPNKPLNLTRNELEQWIGLCLHFSISKLSHARMHWSKHIPGSHEIPGAIMSYNRWQDIKSNFHIVDNTTLQSRNEDKLFKVRPMVDHLRKTFRKIPMTKNLSVDEQMVPFKGACSMKQYIPSKPKKWGFKMFVLADEFGMTYDFMPYTGKIEPVDNPTVPDLKASSNVVLHLAENIPANKNYCLFFDNYFTSVPLLQHLASRKIWACGTVRTPRLPGIKPTKVEDKNLMRKGRGSYEEKKLVTEDCEVTYVRWFDNKVVNIVSTFAKSEPVGTVSRFDHKKLRRVEVDCPDIISRYNKSMGGVDMADALISLYRTQLRSKKYYMKLVFHMLDMSVVNAWLLYKRTASQISIPKSEVMQLQFFKLRISTALLEAGKQKGTKRGRPSSGEASTVPKKVLKTGIRSLPTPDSRFDLVDHWPIIDDVRRICRYEGCKGRTNVKCSKCQVTLCLNNKSNHFKLFHIK